MRNYAITPRFDRLIALTLERGRNVGRIGRVARIVVDFAAGCAYTARKTLSSVLSVDAIKERSVVDTTIRRENEKER